MQYTRYLLALLLLSSFSIGFGQDNIMVSGTILDTDQQPVASGDAFMILKSDSLIVKYTAVKNGNFPFDPIAKGDYFLKLSCLGFLDDIREISLSENKDFTITLNKNVSTLKDVTVTAQKKTFLNDNGNTKIDIEHSIFSTATDALNLLSKLPAIQVDPSGESISIIGKGSPLLYIDNQNVTINELNSLAVGDIKSIEIINNPSAKYEAQGKAVILITRKLNEREGIKIDLTETASLRQFYTNRFGLQASVKKKKLEIKGNLQYNKIKNWEGNSYDFRIDSKDIQSGYNVTSTTTRPQFILGTGIFYQIKERSYFSANTTLRFQKNETFPINTTSFLKEGSIENNVVTNNLNQHERVYTTTTMNYNYFLKKINGQLFLGGQYSTYNQQLSSDIWNDYNNTGNEFSQDRHQKNKIDVLTARIDLEKNFKNNMKLEMGCNISAPTSHSILGIKNYNPDNNLYSNYDYTEKVYAAYSQLSGNLKMINYLIGVRLEHNDVQGKFKDSSSLIIDKRSSQLFPKATIDIPVDSNKSLRLSYAKTISRPDYSKVSRLTAYINPFFEWSSNVNIAPFTTHEITANFQYKDYSLGITYSRQNGPVYADFIYDSIRTRLTRKDRNYELESGISMNLTIPVKYRSWTSSTSIFYGLSKVEDPLAYVDKTKPYLYVYSNNQLALPWDFVFSITGWGVTEQYTGVFERAASFSFDSSLTKTFYKKLNCTLSVNNILKSMPYKERFTINDIAANGKYYDVREFSLAIKYTFGKIKDSNYKSREVDESSGRLN